MAWFRRSEGHDGRGDLADAYLGLRRLVLSLTPHQLSPEAAAAPVLALLLETGHPRAVATLVGVADGTTSLYFSTGGGILGSGEHAPVAEATRVWLERCATDLRLLGPTHSEPEPPDEGVTQFVAVTPDGTVGEAAPQDELGAGGHALSPLFYAGQDVITQIRLIEEAKGS